jgi:hypothetical protein
VSFTEAPSRRVAPVAQAPSRMIARADIRRVQEWMGHADIQTTMRYLHYAPREEDARLVAEAFQAEDVDAAADMA